VHEQAPLSNDTIVSILRHREVGRAKDLAPPRKSMQIRSTTCYKNNACHVTQMLGHPFSRAILTTLSYTVMLSPQVRLLSKWQLKTVFPFRILGAKVLPHTNGILVSLLQKCQGKGKNYEWAASVFQWNKLAFIYAGNYLEFSR